MRAVTTLEGRLLSLRQILDMAMLTGPGLSQVRNINRHSLEAINMQGRRQLQLVAAI